MIDLLSGGNGQFKIKCLQVTTIINMTTCGVNVHPDIQYYSKEKSIITLQKWNGVEKKKKKKKEPHYYVQIPEID